jgi:DNA invertase Pin-like site-specific DNA recombinase
MFVGSSTAGLLDFEGFQNGSFFVGAVSGRTAKHFGSARERMGRGGQSGIPALCGRRIGYARVSTEDQNLALQLDALTAAGCDVVFSDDGVSGAATSRPALNEALAALQRGDILITWKLDRLGRSLAHLIEIIAGLGERGIGFRSLSETIDTTTAGGRLIFHVMGALAEFERALISERTIAGMASAKARGAAIGRPPKLTHEQIQCARNEIEAGTTTPSELAASFGVSPLTLARSLKRLVSAA